MNFIHRILEFHFFGSYFLTHGSTYCNIQCDCLDVTLKVLVDVLVKGPRLQKKFSPPILLNLKIRVGPCMVNLIFLAQMKAIHCKRTLLYTKATRKDAWRAATDSHHPKNPTSLRASLH
jgi:hypothetical protein